MATGWLGWTPKVALKTNVNQIRLAFEGKLDFVRKTNPWGEAEPEVEKTADNLLSFFKKKEEKQLEYEAVEPEKPKIKSRGVATVAPEGRRRRG